MLSFLFFHFSLLTLFFLHSVLILFLFILFHQCKEDLMPFKIYCLSPRMVEPHRLKFIQLKCSLWVPFVFLIFFTISKHQLK